jgi:hypothetical protein
VSSLATKINKSLNSYPSLVNDQHSTTAKSTKKPKKHANSDATLASRVSEKIEEGNLKGAIRLAASEDSLAAYDEETVNALRSIHPPRVLSSYAIPTPLMDLDCDPSQFFAIQDKDIKEAI